LCKVLDKKDVRIVYIRLL